QAKAAAGKTPPSAGGQPCGLPLPGYWRILCELNPNYPGNVNLPTAADVPDAKQIEQLKGFITQCLGDQKEKFHFVFASVPDPVHTHLGMFFDRAVDAMQVAATQAGYLPYSHYLPWKAPQPSTQESAAEVSTSETSDPGVLVLRKQEIRKEGNR